MRFKTYLIEAKLSRAELQKNWTRYNNFYNKIKNGEEFIADGNKVILSKDNLKVMTEPQQLPKIGLVLKDGDLPNILKTENGEIKLSSLEKTAEFGGQGSKKISGADWEMVICCAHNMMSKNVSKEEAIKLAQISKWNSKLDPALETGFEIVKTSFKEPKGVMVHYGAGSNELTDEWNEFFIQTTGKSAFAKTKTPKTDMYISKKHISLKKEGGSQLMSGGEAESLATLAFAYKNIPTNVKTQAFEKNWKKLENDISTKSTKVAGASITDIKREIKKGSKGGIIDIVKEALNNHSGLTDTINSLLQQKEAKEAVVREAMTGQNKFKQDLPVSNYMMLFNEAGYGECKEIDNKVVSHYASKTKFIISFKSTSGRSWTAMRALYLESENLWDTLINESLEETNIMNEGIFKTVKDKIYNFLDKFIKTLWNKIKVYLSKGLEYVYQLLGIEMKANIKLAF